MKSPIFSTIFLWCARVMAFLLVGLLSVAWWDETQARQDPMTQGIPNTDWFYQWAIWTHVAPVVFLLVAIILTWRAPLYGAVGFAIYALVQIMAVGGEWIYLPIVMGPPAVISLCFFLSYFFDKKARA